MSSCQSSEDHTTMSSSYVSNGVKPHKCMCRRFLKPFLMELDLRSAQSNIDKQEIEQLKKQIEQMQHVLDNVVHPEKKDVDVQTT